MASIEEELLMDEEENRREIAFIRERLPMELKEKYTDEQLLWMLDAIVDYYAESGILDTDDEEIEIDVDQVAEHLCEQAKAEGMDGMDTQEVRFVIEADLDFQEENV